MSRFSRKLGKISSWNLKCCDAAGRQTQMRIHLYTICWNESRLLPYFLRHYQQFCESIIVYDNGSDDGSKELIESHPLCELRHIDSHGEMREEILLEVKGQKWKGSRGLADWVICCDVDEILYHPRLLQFLKECGDAGVTIPVPTGFQMIVDHFPEYPGQIYDEVHAGLPDECYSKRVIFNPGTIREINYSAGCHTAEPEGDVHERSDAALKLLHFRFLGLDYLVSRFTALRRRQSQFDREHGLPWTLES